MEMTSFATIAKRFFSNQVRISQKGGKTMKQLLKGLTALMVMMGITTSAHADSGLVTIYPDQIKALGARNSDYSELKTTVPLEHLAGGGVFTTKQCLGWGGFFFKTNTSTHDRFFALLSKALDAGQRIEAYVECNATDNYWPVATSVNIYPDK
jgi:hypothetical protein